MDSIREAAEKLQADLAECECLLIGLGAEWGRLKEAESISAYKSLYQLAKGKNYFVVTTVTDGRIFGTSFDPERMVAPCGNVNWLQCSRSCTKDIWEKGEIPDGICPHCGAPLTGNTIEADCYIEEGYLPQWNRYKEWLSKTLNRRLVLLELGEGFKTPTVIRWPFEKTAFFNQKSHMYRVNKKFFQISGEIRERAHGVETDSVEFVKKFVGK